MALQGYCLIYPAVKSVTYHRPSQQYCSAGRMPTVPMMQKRSQTKTSSPWISVSRGPQIVVTSIMNSSLPALAQMEQARLVWPLAFAATTQSVPLIRHHSANRMVSHPLSQSSSALQGMVTYFTDQMDSMESILISAMGILCQTEVMCMRRGLSHHTQSLALDHLKRSVISHGTDTMSILWKQIEIERHKFLEICCENVTKKSKNWE